MYLNTKNFKFHNNLNQTLDVRQKINGIATFDPTKKKNSDNTKDMEIFYGQNLYAKKQNYVNLKMIVNNISNIKDLFYEKKEKSLNKNN